MSPLSASAEVTHRAGAAMAFGVLEHMLEVVEWLFGLFFAYLAICAALSAILDKPEEPPARSTSCLDLGERHEWRPSGSGLLSPSYYFCRKCGDTFS